MKRYERPAEEEMSRLLEKYGRIKRRLMDWDLSHMDPRDEPPSQGEVVLLIFDDQGRMVVLSASEDGQDTSTLPQGRIGIDEGVEEAATRVALEEAGMRVVVEELAALHQMRIRFRSWELERWYFIMTCRLESVVETAESASLRRVRFIELPQEVPPEWARSQWYLWVLKDVGLVHPHFLLLGRPPE